MTTQEIQLAAGVIALVACLLRYGFLLVKRYIRYRTGGL